MKIFLLFFAVISTAVLSNGFPNELEYNLEEVGLDLEDFGLDSEAFGLDSEEFDDDDDVGQLNEVEIASEADEILCLRDGFLAASKAHPGLQSFFEDLMRTSEKLLKLYRTCNKKTGLRKKLCFARLKLTAAVDYRRLTKKLKKEKQLVIDDIKAVLKKCLASNLFQDLK